MALAFAAFHVAILVIAAAMFVGAALHDAWVYRIPNYICALLLLLFPLFVLTAPRAIDWHQNTMIFGLVGISGFAMFLGNLVGAGDIKLLAVSALWAGPHLIAVLLIVTAITGGVVSLFMAVRTHYRQRNTSEQTQIAKVPIPYGIAIAAGGLTVLAMMAQPILLPASG